MKSMQSAAGSGSTDNACIIRDISLAPSGRRKIDWVKQNMPLLNSVEKEFTADRPFAGLKVALSVHLEAKTAYLCEVMAAGGADMYVTGSNPLSTQDDVAAALAARGLKVFALHAATPEEYDRHLNCVLAPGPDIIIDDGGDLVNRIHNDYPQYLNKVIGGCEETTTGLIRLTAMARDGALRFPMVKVNDARCKYLFDNRYGTGQSVWNGINRTTNLIVAGKQAVVAGYGWCGKGVAMRAKGLGAQVIVTEIDPIKAMEAKMDGFSVMPMIEAAALGDIFVTVTGNEKVITSEHFAVMKSGVILCNAGHFDCEVDMKALRGEAVEAFEQRENIVGYKMADGRVLNVLGEGRLVNLACGDGHPAEIMDMSFAIQALSARWLADHRHEAKMSMVLPVPEAIDNKVAAMKLAFWGLAIDKLTPEQEKYLNSWQL